MRNWDRDAPIEDAHDHANRDMPEVGTCEHCGKPIYGWEDYYDIDGVLLHFNCEYEYMNKFLKLKG